MGQQKVDVLAALDALEGWAREVSDEFIDGGDFRAEYTRDLRGARDARDAIAGLIESARKAQDTNHDGYVLGRPDVSHLPESERAAFLRGWDAASEAVYRTGLRQALAALSTNEGGR